VRVLARSFGVSPSFLLRRYSRLPEVYREQLRILLEVRAGR
jgi:hypothetical protein